MLAILSYTSFFLEQLKLSLRYLVDFDQVLKTEFAVVGGLYSFISQLCIMSLTRHELGTQFIVRTELQIREMQNYTSQFFLSSLSHRSHSNLLGMISHLAAGKYEFGEILLKELILVQSTNLRDQP